MDNLLSILSFVTLIVSIMVVVAIIKIARLAEKQLEANLDTARGIRDAGRTLTSIASVLN